MFFSTFLSHTNRCGAWRKNLRIMTTNPLTPPPPSLVPIKDYFFFICGLTKMIFDWKSVSVCPLMFDVFGIFGSM